MSVRRSASGESPSPDASNLAMTKASTGVRTRSLACTLGTGDRCGGRNDHQSRSASLVGALSSASSLGGGGAGAPTLIHWRINCSSDSLTGLMESA